jgi:3-oxoacyl-[acyl-carrier-protein] synthase II
VNAGSRRVVITGVGAVTSLGLSARENWEAMVAGRSGVDYITAFDSTAFQVHIASEVRRFNPEELLDRREARRMDRFTQFAVYCAELAVRDAGLAVPFASEEEAARMGVIVGSGIGGLIEIETQHRRLLEEGPGRISPFMIPKLMVNAASGNVSIRYGCKGPNTAVATACASGAHAIGDAFRVIQRNEADIMLTGGSEAAITAMGLGGFDSMRALSRHNDPPQGASRPFDKHRDGFVLGEGAGIVVLEELEHARRRGARIYTELVGYGASADASHIAAPEPGGRGAAQAVVQALKDAQLDPDRVDYINAHGTSTPLGDITETKAVHAVFGPHARRLAVSSNKSMIGHLLGASGAVELIMTSYTIAEGIIPPTINYETPDPDCDLDYVPNEAREARVDVAISNSFGFGGHNCCLVVKRFAG